MFRARLFQKDLYRTKQSFPTVYNSFGIVLSHIHDLQESTLICFIINRCLFYIVIFIQFYLKCLLFIQ